MSTASIPNTAAGFQTTSWTLIASAKENRMDFDRLLRLYWNPIYGYIRRRGYSRSEADDLTQQFIVSVVMERKLIEKADATLGKFRTFVLTCLKHFLVDESRRPRTPTLMHDDEFERDGQIDPEDSFHLEWATSVLSIAMQRLEEQCRRQGMTRQWRVFESRTLGPIVHGHERAAIKTLMREFSIEDRQIVDSMGQTMQNKARRAIAEVITETVGPNDDFDDEMRMFKRLLLGRP
jgi:RNA polymerase sigma-70 factor (ECF subfamily)